MEQVNNSTEQAGATARAVCIHIAKEMSELEAYTRTNGTRQYASRWYERFSHYK